MDNTKKTQQISIAPYEVILSDIAGTTTGIPFIKDLFKYAIDNIHAFIKSNWNHEEVQHAIKLLASDDKTQEQVCELFIEKTNKNDNNEGLKILQGLIYKQGYESKTLKGHIFPDVMKCFQVWSQTHRIAIFSTGSVESQRLLLSHTNEGDLSKYIENYFDLSVGIKTKSESYKNIADKLKVAPSKILFLTDFVTEAEAAEEASCKAVLVSRPGNSKIPEESLERFTIINSFDELKTE